MKTLFYISVFTIIAISSAIAQEDCIGFLCGPKCRPDEKLYSSGCDYLKPEPTCENPSPKQDMRGKLCDYVKCYCKAPRVRNTVDNSCICPRDCPKKCDL